MLDVYRPISRVLICLSLMVAMASIGFAHTGFNKSPTPELKAYLAAGGDLSDICGSAQDQNGTSGPRCEACHLMGAAVMPQTPLGTPVVLSGETRVLSFVAKRLHQSRELDPTRLSRAPPKA